jgi:hypothetical protein
MKRSVAAMLSVLAVATGVGWKVASHPETSATLQKIRLKQQSERSQPAFNNALAGIRIRISPADFGYELRAPADKVPQIALAAE